jgi:hypothetical protein
MKKLLNKLNGWQRIYLILSVVWASIVCFTEIVLEEQIKESWRIEKPSERLMDDAYPKYENYVRKQTYEQYLATYKEQYDAYLISDAGDTNKREGFGLFDTTQFGFRYSTDPNLPEYIRMGKFLHSKGIPVSEGLSLNWTHKVGPFAPHPQSFLKSRFGAMFIREQFPEFSEEFDGIDKTLKEKYRYKVAYVKELAQNYLLSPLKIFAVVILPIIGVYWLLLAMISLTRWVLAGFSS